ncbi:MAG: hypothetical protein MJ007_02275 [Paludibacteraceae bacterium]|nr:hypothetical protein [Paludibacteraceae bacterium]
MKKFHLLVLLLAVSSYAVPQAVVTDPTSMAQRIALFFEEMEESISQSLDIADNAENMSRLFELTKESADKLRKVSEFIKASRQLVNITESELRIADKMEKYINRVNEMDGLTMTEKINIISSIMNLGTAAAERIKFGVEMAKNGANDADFSDFERIEILSKIEGEVLALEEAIDKAYELSISKEIKDGFMSGLDNMKIQAMTFSF